MIVSLLILEALWAQHLGLLHLHCVHMTLFYGDFAPKPNTPYTIFSNVQIRRNVISPFKITGYSVFSCMVSKHKFFKDKWQFPWLLLAHKQIPAGTFKCNTLKELLLSILQISCLLTAHIFTHCCSVLESCIICFLLFSSSNVWRL